MTGPCNKIAFMLEYLSFKIYRLLHASDSFVEMCMFQLETCLVINNLAKVERCFEFLVIYKLVPVR
jgi:uncharacterized protein YebE (UPF0316 family)